TSRDKINRHTVILAVAQFPSFENPTFVAAQSPARATQPLRTRTRINREETAKSKHDSNMYGGDEVSAIVIDLGSHTCKAGYAGEDAPKAVFPSVVGSIDKMEVDDPVSDSNSTVKTFETEKGKSKRKLYVGTQSLGYRRDYMEVLSPIKDGVVADWDIADAIWDHAFRECLLVDPTEHPMLLAESSSNNPYQRER
ncbi:Actin-related protein, partial [Drosera capensis]